MRKDYSLYFVAIILPEHIGNEINKFKEDFAVRFNSRHALKVVPHITLKAPFELLTANHESTVQWFENMHVKVTGFEQELSDFGVFDNRRNPVVYVKPAMNESLKLLQSETLQNFMTAYPHENISKNEFSFSPHITIAYRDLKPSLFKEAWKEYAGRKYFAHFKVDSFSLLQHDNKRWNIISTYRLE